MTEFGQGLVLGLFLGSVFGVAGVLLYAMMRISKDSDRVNAERSEARPQSEAERIQRSLSRFRNAVPIALILFIVAGCGSTVVTKVEVRERIDTLLVKGDTIRVVQVESDTVYVDTLKQGTQVIGFRSVRAALDTTVRGVRMYLQYAYPPDRWSADILQRDTVIKWKVRDSIIHEPYPVSEVPFWIYLTLVGMIAALAVVLFKR